MKKDMEISGGRYYIGCDGCDDWWKKILLTVLQECCGVIYGFIYIYITLLSTSIHSHQGKEKKKPPEFRDNNIPNHCRGEKKNNSLREKIKIKGQLRHTS